MILSRMQAKMHNFDQVVEMVVRMDCNGCERTVRKALSRIRGIDSVDIDLKQNKVTVRGYVDRMMVLRAIRRAGKRAEFWNPHQRDDYFRHLPNAFSYGHPPNTNAFSRTYNYEWHGYNIPYEHHDSQYFNTPHDGITTFFNDENPNACSMM